MAKIIVLVSTLLLGGCGTPGAVWDTVSALVAVDLVHQLTKD